MDFILVIFFLIICYEVMSLTIYVCLLRATPNFRKAVKLFPVPQKLLTDKKWSIPRRVFFVRDQCGAKKYAYNFKTTKDGILLQDLMPQYLFILFPLRLVRTFILRLLVISTIFLPWNSLSAPEPEKPSMFGVLTNEDRVTFCVVGSPIILSMNRKDLFEYL